MKQKCTKLIYVNVVFPIDCQVQVQQLVFQATSLIIAFDRHQINLLL